MSPARVLIVTRSFPPDHGGPATHCYDLRVELMHRGHEVSVLTLTDGRSTTKDGITYLARGWPIPMRTLVVVARMLATKGGYDAVYAAGMHSPSVLGGRLARRPVVVRVVGDEVNLRSRSRGWSNLRAAEFYAQKHPGIRIRFTRFLRDTSLRNASAVFTLTPELAHRTAGYLRWTELPRVIPNGVRIPPVVDPAPPQPPLRAIFVGRLVPGKRVHVLIEALALAPGVTLEIVGEGESADDLRDSARDNGVSDRVQFAGGLPHDDAMDRMAAAHVLAQGPSFESLSHVALEAMARGKPVIRPQERSFDDLVRDGVNGLVVDPTPQSIAGALTKLRDDPEMVGRLGAAARESSLPWSIEACTDQIEALLEDVSSASRS